MRLFLLITLIFSFISVELTHAQSYLEVERTGVSEEANASRAKKEILDTVIREVSEEQILKLVGEKSFNSNRTVVENEILNKSGKYIVFFKTKDFRYQQGVYSQSVYLKLDMKSLQSVLLKSGLLYDQKEKPVILPFLKVADRSRSKSFAWWTTEATQKKGLEKLDLSSLAKSFEKVVSKELKEAGAYLVPALQSEYVNLVPEKLRKNRLSAREKVELAKIFDGNLYMVGELNLMGAGRLIEETKMTVYLSLVSIENEKVIAELSRKFKSNDSGSTHLEKSEIEKFVSEAVKDLKAQLEQAWQKGAFGSKSIRLAFKGNFSYKEIEKLKELLSGNVRLVKTLRERLFEPGKVSFEVDMNGTAQDIFEFLKERSPLELHELKVSELSIDSLVIEKTPKPNL